MARNFRFQKVRTDNRKQSDRPDDKPPGHIVFEPVDIALVVIILLIAIWLQWLLGTLSS